MPRSPPVRAGARFLPLTLPGWLSNLTPARLLRTALAWRGSIAAPLGVGWQRELEVLRETRRIVPLLMIDAAALNIQICVRAARQLDGVMAEAGVLMGGSARLISESKQSVPLHLFDVFETLQSAHALPSSRLSARVGEHFGSICGTLDQVERLLAPYEQIHFHPGVFPGSVPPELQDAQFSFVHLDMDLAESTRAGLEFFHPRLVAGGILVGDDYNDVAVRETFAAYFRDRPDTMIEFPWGQVMVVKQP